MKIVYLGTGGAEGVPSIYCHCEVCQRALKRGGRELRSRAGFLIDDELLIDFSPDTYLHCVKYKIDMSAIKNMFITHSHEDHFYLPDLISRLSSPAVTRTVETMTVYGNETVKAEFDQAAAQFCNLTASCVKISAGETVKTDGFTITAFKTTHVASEESLIYLIERNGKKYFHILDSSYPDEKVFSYFAENKIRLDVVSADCTFGNMRQEFGGHMNIWQNVKLKARLEELGAADENTKYVLTHVSHYCKDTFASLNKTAKKYGMTVSYDGMKIEI
ncbi:MAG: hypothetical protein IJB97_10120 [Clostridia bacterium]|nr:hypothetical protein [Clostridia bacterium]